jgi:glycosyltransferase involved in cell wall biosynthesis
MTSPILRILWISQTYLTSQPGGTIGATSRIEMPRLIAQMGHRVCVVVGTSLSDLLRRTAIVPHSDVVYLPMMNRPIWTTLTFQLALSVLLCGLLLRCAPQVVIVDHFSVPTIAPWVILRKLGLLRTRFVLDVRTLPVETAGRRGQVTQGRFDSAVRFAVRHLDGITVVTPRLRSYLAERFGLDEGQIGVWATGADMARMENARERREELGWAGRFVVIHHGTLSANRGLQATVQAFAQLRADCPEARLCLLGAGPAQAELTALIESLGLADVVWLYPPVRYDQVPDYLASADVGIIPLPDLDWWNTSSPIKLFEYLASGKPVILSRIAAHERVAPAAEYAYYLDDLAPETIAAAIRHHYSRRAELKQLGRQGQELVRTKHSWMAQAQALIDYLSARCNRDSVQTRTPAK